MAKVGVCPEVDEQSQNRGARVRQYQLVCETDVGHTGSMRRAACLSADVGGDVCSASLYLMLEGRDGDKVVARTM
jgi:hypothetical protein